MGEIIPFVLPDMNDEDQTLFTLPNETGTPERRLLLAVLERAILDFVGNDKRELDEAEEWIFRDAPRFEDENGEMPVVYPEFSFGWICQELDLSPAMIANEIRRMPKRGNSRIAPWYTNKDSIKKDMTANGGLHSKTRNENTQNQNRDERRIQRVAHG